MQATTVGTMFSSKKMIQAHRNKNVQLSQSVKKDPWIMSPSKKKKKVLYGFLPQLLFIFIMEKKVVHNIFSHNIYLKLKLGITDLDLLRI